MRFSFKKRLSSLVSPLLKLFRMPGDIPNGAEFRTEELPVGAYLELLGHNYNTPAESQELRAVKLSLYKQKTTSQHEYVVVTVQNRQGAYHYFRIERMPDSRVRESVPTSPTDSSLSLPEAPPMPSSSSAPSLRSSETSHHSRSLRPKPSISSVNSFSKDQPAKDIVLWVQYPRTLPNDCLLGVLTFPTQPTATSPVFFYNIIVLADTLHKSYPLYQLFSHNCYHLAGTITKVLELACGVCMVKEQSVPTHLRKGSWYIIGRTFNPEEKDFATDIEKLKTEYEVATKNFKQALEKKAEAAAERERENERLKRESEAVKEAAREKERELQEQIEQLQAELAKQGSSQA
ncbi:hypothetical protein FPV67DRAFT_1502925 [Lyophyllum atratum]|nr:hypothetical protein FPV67DRAFT_1502925 [Lyophyllum atratum]